MLRYFFLSFIVIVVCVVSLLGFRSDNIFGLGHRSPNPPLQIFPDMKHQPKFQPQHESSFFADGRAARAPIPGTVPLGYTIAHSYYQTGATNRSETAGFTNFPDYYNTGKIGDVYGDGFPVDVDEALLARGQERFNINCAVCHGAVGAGDGIVKSYGLITVASLQDERIRTMPDGQIFSTITNGKNTMGAYGPQIAVDDRWAIVAYLRALQKSQNARLAELPEARQQELNSKQ
jgi:mono/diheme cytochrome c family protein